MQIKLFFVLSIAFLGVQSCHLSSSQANLHMLPPSVKLPFGTNLTLIATQKPLIGDIKQGSRLAFQVTEPIEINRKTIISAHAMGTVEVVRLQQNGSSRADAVTLRAHSVAMANGRIVALKSEDIILSVNLSDKQARLLPLNFRLAAYTAETVEIQP